MAEIKARRQLISDTVVARLQPQDKPFTKWCEVLPGFGIRVMPSGAKTYIAQYRIGRGRGARQGMQKLGSPSLITADEARKKAEATLKSAAAGEDPKAKPDTDDITTIEKLAEKFLTDHVKIRLKESTQGEYERAIRRDIIGSKLGNYAIRELDYAHVHSWHNAMSKTPYQANRNLAYLQTMLNFAERLKLRDRGSNPCTEVERFPEIQRKSYFTNEEIQALAAELDRVDHEKPTFKGYVGCIRLLFLTGCRLSEILSLKWLDDETCNFVDLNKNEFKFRAHKTDKKGGDKVVHLSDDALEAIQKIPRKNSTEYVVFAADGEAQASTDALEHFWRDIREAAGFKRRMHDLRHTFASAGVTAGLGLAAIGALLGHRSPATTARYAHLVDDARKAATDKIAGILSAAVNGGKKPTKKKSKTRKAKR